MTVSLSGNLILLVVLLSVTIAWRVKRDSEVKETEQTICEPCFHLSTDGTVPDGCKNVTDKCCCKASVLINALVKKVRKREMPREMKPWSLGKKKRYSSCNFEKESLIFAFKTNAFIWRWAIQCSSKTWNIFVNKKYRWRFDVFASP